MGDFRLFGILCPGVLRQYSNTERTLFTLDFAIVTPLDTGPVLQKLYNIIIAKHQCPLGFSGSGLWYRPGLFRTLVWFGLFSTPGVSWALNSFRRLHCIVLHVFPYTTPFSSASLSSATNINTECKHKTQNVKTIVNDLNYKTWMIFALIAVYEFALAHVIGFCVQPSSSDCARLDSSSCVIVIASGLIAVSFES